MFTAVLTYLVVVVVCLAPGGLLGFVVAPGRERWIVWAAAPILTLGLTALGMAWLPAIGLPSSAEWVLGAEIVLAALAVAGSWLVARRWSGAVPAPERAVPKVLAAAGHAEGARAPASPGQAAGSANGHPTPADSPGQAVTWRSWLRGGQRPRFADLIGVAVPAAVSVGFGSLLLGGLAEPPGWDAMNHALLTRNILDTGSTAATAVCTTGGSLPRVSCQFYPLGADISWAQTAVLSGGHIGAAMTAWSVVIGPTALVVALYAAVRALGGRPLVASCAAVAPVVLGPLWPALLTGRPPEAFGPGMSIAVALMAALAMRGKYPVRFGLLAGLGFAGLLMTHTYEVLFAAPLALAFLFAGPLRMNPRRALVAIGAIGIATVATVAPLAGVLLGAGGERVSSKPQDVGHLSLAWHYWVTDPQGYTLLGPPPYIGSSLLHILPIRVALALTVPCLLASPLCLVFKQLRWARPWLLAWALWTALGIWTSVSASPPSLFLSGLWYGFPARLRTMVLPLHAVLAVAGACAIGLCLYRLVTTVGRYGRDLRLEGMSAAAAAGVLAVSLVGLAALPSARATLESQFQERSPAGTAYPQVFEWLAAHTPPGKVVAYDRHKEFMTWSYADYGVAELFGIPPLVKANKANYDDRWQAWAWLVGTAGAKPSGCLVGKYGIEYVVVGKTLFPTYKRDYSGARLAASPNVTLVHSYGGLRVYQVSKSGMACPSSA